MDVVVQREESFLAGFGIEDAWHQLILLSVLTFFIWGLELFSNISTAYCGEIWHKPFSTNCALRPLAMCKNRAWGGLMKDKRETY